MRRHFTFDCEGSRLVGTIDAAPGAAGLLIVSGGNETRAGAWDGQAELAARIAAAGFPVLRFDRRGVGDSEGTNRSFRHSGSDIAAALAALRRECPAVLRVAGFGNCDAASALMLARGAGCDGLVLSNPWTFDDDAAEPPAEVVRAHYRRRLADPAALRRLLTGKVAIGAALRSAVGALRRPPPAQSPLLREMALGIDGFDGEVAFLVAGRDRTGLAFAAGWDKRDPRVATCPGASHSYVEPDARDWLAGQLLRMLRSQAAISTGRSR